MKEQTTTTNIYVSDRNWFDTLKRKTRKGSAAELWRSIKKMIIKCKVQEEIE